MDHISCLLLLFQWEMTSSNTRTCKIFDYKQHLIISFFLCKMWLEKCRQSLRMLPILKCTLSTNTSNQKLVIRRFLVIILREKQAFMVEADWQMEKFQIDGFETRNYSQKASGFLLGLILRYISGQNCHIFVSYWHALGSVWSTAWIQTKIVKQEAFGFSTIALQIFTKMY